jgi:ribonuclease P protein component
LKSARISELLKTNPKTSKAWGLYFGERPPSTGANLGIAVAKKMAKRAVDRNKLKRLIRETIRKPQTNVLNSSDVVVRLRKPIGQTTRGRLREAEYKTLRQQISGLM